MSGSVLDLVRDSICRSYGDGLWEAILTGTEARDAPSDSLAAWLGAEGLYLTADRYPSLVARHRSLGAFLSALGDDVPVSAASPRPGAVPVLDFQPTLDADLLIGIRGAGRACALLQGVVAAAARRYGEAARVHHLKCVAQGDNRCVLRVGFEDGVSAGAGPGRSFGARARTA